MHVGNVCAIRTTEVVDRNTIVNTKALYLWFPNVAIGVRLYLHFCICKRLGFRGCIIVGTQQLVVRPSRELKPSLAWYGIASMRFPPFNPVLKQQAIHCSLPKRRIRPARVGVSTTGAINTLFQSLGGWTISSPKLCLGQGALAGY